MALVAKVRTINNLTDLSGKKATNSLVFITPPTRHFTFNV